MFFSSCSQEAVKENDLSFVKENIVKILVDKSSVKSKSIYFDSLLNDPLYNLKSNNKEMAYIGFGFVLKGEENIVISSTHNFRDKNAEYFIENIGKKIFPLKIERVSKERDIAILKFEGASFSSGLNTSEKIEKDERVFVFSNLKISDPLKIEEFIDYENIEEQQIQNLIKINKDMTKGDSGSPIINKKGEVVAIVTAVSSLEKDSILASVLSDFTGF